MNNRILGCHGSGGPPARRLVASSLTPHVRHALAKKVLHGLMDELCGYVERDLAFRWRRMAQAASLSERDAGLAYLRNVVGAQKDLSPSPSSDLAGATHPGDLSVPEASGLITLYTWWRDVRPMRPNPRIASGVQAFTDAMSFKYRDAFMEPKDDLGAFEALSRTPFLPKSFAKSSAMTADETSQYRGLLAVEEAMEKESSEEDSSMMILMMGLRESLH